MADLNASSFSRNGLADWLIQRLSAVILGLFALLIVVFLLIAQPLDYLRWQAFFANIWVQVFVVAAVCAFIAHAWIGLWTIATDYLKTTAWRMLFQSAFMLILLGVLWTVVRTLWSF